MSLENILQDNLFKNLYDNQEILDFEDGFFYKEDDLSNVEKKDGPAFRSNLYSFSCFGLQPSIKDFLDGVIDDPDYYNRLFEPGMHWPVIGIYDADSNHVIGIGSGRKNRMFVVSTNPDINSDGSDLDKFSKCDPCGLVNAIWNLFEETANSNGEWLELQLFAQEHGINDVVDLDAASDEEENGLTEEQIQKHKQRMEDVGFQIDQGMEKLIVLIPGLPENFGDISDSLL
jgi:hypothetical protein|tara:strand:- start:74 stop:763 length:690 start_codon:yes stop_codon:yes gene_type:complete